MHLINNRTPIFIHQLMLSWTHLFLSHYILFLTLNKFILYVCMLSHVSHVQPFVVQPCDPMNCSLPTFFVHGILQAKTLEWVAISCSRGSFWPRDWTWIFEFSCIGRWVPYQYWVAKRKKINYLYIHLLYI